VSGGKRRSVENRPNNVIRALASPGEFVGIFMINKVLTLLCVRGRGVGGGLSSKGMSALIKLKADLEAQERGEEGGGDQGH
jgi:hypothetical protein